MKIGKLNNDDLKKLVLDRLPDVAGSITAGPLVGLDCAAIRFCDGQVVLTSDPITGAAKQIGRLAIHIACNDIAVCGIRPIAVMLVIIAPSSAEPDDIADVVSQASEAARKLSISIVGGHTEVSEAVSRFVIMTTAVGFTYGAQIIQASGGQAGDSLVMTKTAGLEGTAVLAEDKADRLSGWMTGDEIKEACRLIDSISVIEEGSCGGKTGVHAMHDATEGGILGACWEMSEASGLGCLIDMACIPVHPLTRKICQILSLDPLRLIASGSMLIATSDPEALIAELAVRDIPGTIIGKLTQKPDRLVSYNGELKILAPPESDELYKIR